MGCDIHATLEYDKWKLKRPDDDHDWWAFAKNIDIDRSYYLFTVLAGVRDHKEVRPIIALPRGIPKDAGYEYIEEVEEWNSDGHSHSYVTFKELKDWKQEPSENEFSFRDEDWYKTMAMLAEKYGDENVRLIFFFDN